MAHNVLDTLPFPTTQTAAGYGITYSSPVGDGSRVNPMSTGGMNNTLSAPTANPFYDNDGCSTAKFRSDLAGKIYSIVDQRAGTFQPKLLRAVQLNLTAATSNGTVAIPGLVALVVQPAPTSAVNGFSQGTALQMGGESDATAGAHGRWGVVALRGGSVSNLPSGMTAAGTNSAPIAGAPSKPLYDGYTAGRVLLCGDWVYVVEEGPCIVPLSNNGSFTVGFEASAYSDGGYHNAADGDTVVGTWTAVNNTSAAVGPLGPYQGLLMVKRGYQDDRTGAT